MGGEPCLEEMAEMAEIGDKINVEVGEGRQKYFQFSLMC